MSPAAPLSVPPWPRHRQAALPHSPHRPPTRQGCGSSCTPAAAGFPRRLPGVCPAGACPPGWGPAPAGDEEGPLASAAAPASLSRGPSSCLLLWGRSRAGGSGQPRSAPLCRELPSTGRCRELLYRHRRKKSAAAAAAARVFVSASLHQATLSKQSSGAKSRNGSSGSPTSGPRLPLGTGAASGECRQTGTGKRQRRGCAPAPRSSRPRGGQGGHRGGTRWGTQPHSPMSAGRSGRRGLRLRRHGAQGPARGQAAGHAGRGLWGG